MTSYTLSTCEPIASGQIREWVTYEGDSMGRFLVLSALEIPMPDDTFDAAWLLYHRGKQTWAFHDDIILESKIIT